MNEVIIGREHGTNRLILTAKGKGYAISAQGSVPKTVSSTHCRLQIDDQGTMTLSNIKSELNTYVNGIQINSKRITFDSRVELGVDHYLLDMKLLRKVLDEAFPPPPVVFSLAPLEQVWEDYQTASEEMVIKEQKLNNVRNLQGVFMTSGVVLMLLPQLLNMEFPPILNVLRFILSIPAIVIPIFFFIRGRDTSKSLIYQQKTLKKDFEAKYVCPNPKCNRFMGYIPYSTLKFSQRCANPECACQYTYK